jgi:hypothetical protein
MDLAKLAGLMKKKKADLTKREKTLKIQPGVTRYVLLPGWDEAAREVFFHAFGQHFIKDAADEIQAIYPCAKETFGEPCAVCDGLNKAIKMVHDDETVEVLKKAVASAKFLINVLALDSTEPNTPQILEVPKTVFANIVSLTEDWGAQLFDPANPQILTIEKTGKGLSTRYTVGVSPKTSKLPAAAMAAIPNLATYVHQEGEEQMKRALVAIQSVAGLLPSADTPRTSESRMLPGKKVDAEEARMVERASTKPDLPSIDDDLDALLDSGLDDLDELTGT